MKRVTLNVILGLAILLGQTSCGAEREVPLKPALDSRNSPAIVIGSQLFTENIIVAEIYAQVLEKSGIPVQRKLRLGNTDELHEQIIKGSINLYPEYTGSALAIVLRLPKTTNSANALYEQVKKEYVTRYNLQWLNPAPMTNSYAFAMSRETARRLNVKTLSEFAPLAEEFTLITPTHWNEKRTDTDSLRNLQQTYGGFKFKELKIVPEVERYKVFRTFSNEIVLAYTTDSEISSDNLVLLEDDKQFFPVYQVAPVVRQEILKNYPQLKDILDVVSARLTTSAIVSMNLRVDGPNRQSVEAVARNFLVLEGLIK